MLRSGKRQPDREMALDTRRWGDPQASVRTERWLAHEPLRRDRSDGIDMLRAVFALWVVLAHLIPWSVYAQGPGAVPGWIVQTAHILQLAFQPISELHPAVVAFIVLSGYCIHRAGLRAPGSGEIAGYAIRRFFRIMPLYYLAIAAGLAGFLFASRHAPKLAAAMSGTEAISGGCIAAKAAVLSAFWPSWYECGFLGNAPLATVVVEIVLYILYAAAFAGLVWRGREAIVWLACGGSFLFSLAMLDIGMGPHFYGWWQNGSIFSFLPYWWLGVLFVNPRFASECRRRWWLILAVWAALTVLLLFGAPAGIQAVAELRKLCFALAAGVLIAATDNARLRPLAVLAPVGRAGYGIYAMHAPLTYTLIVYGLAWWIVLLANVLAGLLIHWAIERPLVDLGRALRNRLARRTIAAAPMRAMP
jgi:peptidoglycan/LPS O-acetylase OafA/YrhL